MQQARQLSAGSRVISPALPGRNPGIQAEPGYRYRKAKLLVTVFTCFLLSLFVVAQYSSLVILNYRLSGARAELAELKEVSRILEVEAAQLASIGRIEQIAREELGMVEPEIGQLIVLTARQGEGGSLGE
jgi:cell division protein FtsB